MKRLQPLFLYVTAMLVSTVLAATAHATLLPAKDSSSPFGNNYSLGFSDGVLYLYTGNSIYQVDRTDPDNPVFTLHMTDLEQAFDGPTRAAEGGMAIADNGQAFIPFGFTSRGVLKVDLNAKTTQEITAYDETNIYGAAGRADGNFYAQAEAEDGSTSTRIDRVTPGLTVTTDVADPQDLSSGGMAFDSAGNLIVGTFDWMNGQANFYRITATELAAFESNSTTPTLTFLGSGAANGNGTLLVDKDGLIFFNTTTGIGMLDPDTGNVTNFFRDILDPDLFTYANLPLNGLAYDPDTHELIFAQYNETLAGYELTSVIIPEPATALMVLGVAAWLGVRRRHYRVQR